VDQHLHERLLRHHRHRPHAGMNALKQHSPLDVHGSLVCFVLQKPQHKMYHDTFACIIAQNTFSFWILSILREVSR